MKHSREGENIAFEVLNVCKEANRRLRVRRARFSALIQRDLEQSLRTLVEPNKLESDAVDIRMELDMRIGFAYTRFQTRRWRNRFEIKTDDPISYGPCQFPTLGFVVDQFWKHKHFRPEPFWYLNLEVAKNGKTCKLEWNRARLFDQLVCLIIYEKLLEPITAPAAAAQAPGQPQNGTGVNINPNAKLKVQVVKVQKQPKRRWRPLPLTTVELQKNMSRILRISAQDTMNIAERLYQAGFVSYPRTETDRFPANFDYHTLIGQQEAHPTWGAYATKLLNQLGEFVVPKAGSHDDSSHPPIHPTKGDAGQSLNGRDAQVYEFIVRHYLACCSQDALGNETIVEMCVSDQEMFHVKGTSVEKLNFLEIYTYQSWPNATVPHFELNELVDATKLTMENGSTTAPPLLTEADLIQLMNQNGIGTDATIAEHIATIIQRKYVIKQGARGEMSPTQLGEALVAGYNFIGYRKLNQPQLRAGLEADLKRVCIGQVMVPAVLQTQIAMYRNFFNEIKAQVASLDKALAKYFAPVGTVISHQQPRFSKCGQCGSMMSLQSGVNDFVAVHCDRCALQLRLPGGTISPTVVQEGVDNPFYCPICNYQVLSVESRNGKVFNVCPHCYNNPLPHLRGPETDTGEGPTMPCFKCSQQGCPLRASSISFDQSPVRACPSCAQPMIIRQSKNSSYLLACSNYPTCRKSLWFPLELVKEIRPKSTSCPHCHVKPNLQVEIFYSPQEVFSTGTESITGCLYNCEGSRAVRSLLEEITRGFAAWEATPAPPPNPTAKVVTAKATAGAKRGTGATAGAKKTAPARNAKYGATAKPSAATAKGASGSKYGATAKTAYGSAKSGASAAKATAPKATASAYGAPRAGAKKGATSTSTTTAGALKGFGAKATTFAAPSSYARPAAHGIGNATPAAAKTGFGATSSNIFAKRSTAATSNASTGSAGPSTVQIHRQPHLSTHAKPTSGASSSAPYGTPGGSVFGVRR